MEDSTSLARCGDSPPLTLKCSLQEQDDGTVVVNEVVEKNYYKKAIIPDDEHKEKNMKAYRDEIAIQVSKLMIAFPMPLNSESERNRATAFTSSICGSIERNRMSIEHLEDSINWLIDHHKYRTFTIADILGFERKIVLGLNIQSLERKMKTKLMYEQIAITYEIIDDKVFRLYGLIEDVKAHPEYRNKIIGVWDSQKKKWEWIGKVNDPSIPIRQQEFYCRILEYLNKPPRYNGPYSPEVCRAFYNEYSEVVPPGDRLRCDRLGFDIETWLCSFNSKYQENGNIKDSRCGK